MICCQEINYIHLHLQRYRYMPVFPGEPEGFGKDAMKPLASQRVVIGCFEAFKIPLRIERCGAPVLCPRYSTRVSKKIGLRNLISIISI